MTLGSGPSAQCRRRKRLWWDALAPGCVDGLTSDCGLVRGMSEVNFSAYGLVHLTEVDQGTVVSVSD